MSRVFPEAFRELLSVILRRAPRLRGASTESIRARRKHTAQVGIFAGHRAYAMGDDLRMLDWNAYARTGELFLKVLEEEDRRVLTILVDCSPSMEVGEPLRFHGALRLGAILGGLALVHLDGVHLVAGPGRSWSLQGAGAVPGLLHDLETMNLEPQQPIDLVGAALAAGHAGSFCWISDFAEPDRLAPALALLRRRGRRCVGWLPGVREDSHPLARGWLRVRDPESGEYQVMQVDRDLARAMEQELALLRLQQKQVFSVCGQPLLRFSLPAEGDFRFASWMEAVWSHRI